MDQGLFKHIIGHETACQLFLRLLERGHVAHAYLFAGPEHVGKTTFAEAFISGLLPQATDLSTNPDFIRLNRPTDEKTGTIKSNVSVEQIRALRERFSMTSFLGGRKVAFIEDAGAMNTAAANALLKTLEEPSGDAVLILRASSADELPLTIVSRCQVIRFAPVPRETLCDALVARGIGRDEAHHLAGFAAGRPGLALGLIQDSQQRAEAEVGVSTLLRLLGESKAQRLAAAAELLPKNAANPFETVLSLFDRWERIVRDLMLLSAGCEELVAHSASLEAFRPLTERRSALHWANVLRRLQEARMRAAEHANPVLALEHCLLSM